jgi:predicted AlkP superfamily phosphohydrolase/phosphomutase
MARAPLLVVGLDAGSPELVRTWAAQGHMPTLAALAERGTAADLTGDELLMEHGMWAAMFSGRTRGELDRFTYREPVPGENRLRIGPLARPPVPLLWEAPARAGMRVVLFDVPSAPADPDLPAEQLSYWAVHDRDAEPTWHPAGVPERVGLRPPPDLQRVHLESEGEARDSAFLASVLGQIERRGQMARALVAGERPPGLTTMVFSETHTAAHRLWRHHNGGDGAAPALRHALREVYSAVDREIGALAAALGPQTAVVALVANGIVDRCPVDALVADFCHTLGYAKAPAAGRRPVDWAARAMPTALRGWMGRRLPERRVEELIARRFAGAYDWERTRVFSIPDPFTAMLRVNLAGREPNGPVSEGAEYERLVGELQEDLRALRDPATGAPAVERVSRLRARDGAPPPWAPDVVGVFAPHSRPLRALEHPRGRVTQPEPWWPARNGHAAHGLVVAAGAGVPGRPASGPVTCLDVAPSLLALMGEPVPGHMPGRPSAALAAVAV